MKNIPKNHYLFTSESVSESHPDAVADSISDAINDWFIAFDRKSHCAIETLVTTGQVVVAGEVKSNAYLDIPSIVRDTINDRGYTKAEYGFAGNSCGVLTAIHEQSANIDMGVTKANEEDAGAGDQGMMFGYACTQCDDFMPATISIAHNIMRVLADIRKNADGIMDYLRPDSKCQVTIEYDEHDVPVRIDSILVSTQHDPFESTEIMQKTITNDIKKYVIPVVQDMYSEKIANLFDDENINYYVNPTGCFEDGGPAYDTGLTGRKLVVSSYGGWGNLGGGAQCGKSPDKQDRAGMYITRYLAKNCVAAGVADQMLIEISYGIGMKEPLSLFVNTYGTNHTQYSDSEIAEKLYELFDLTPYGIIKNLKLDNPIYYETAAYGQVGQEPKVVKKHFDNKYGDVIDVEVELFTWEKLDAVERLQNAFFNHTAK